MMIEAQAVVSTANATWWLVYVTAGLAILTLAVVIAAVWVPAWQRGRDEAERGKQRLASADDVRGAAEDAWKIFNEAEAALARVDEEGFRREMLQIGQRASTVRLVLTSLEQTRPLSYHVLLLDCEAAALSGETFMACGIASAHTSDMELRQAIDQLIAMRLRADRVRNLVDLVASECREERERGA